MKKLLTLTFVCFSLSAMALEENTVTTKLVLGDDPRSGVIHSLCVEGFVFAIYRNQRTVTSQGTYAGESQSSSMVQVLNERGYGIKCQKAKK
tara:strand:- start:660 stop:935 length:276 start_codon:yes stop_codon:yes gene_type:complete